MPDDTPHPDPRYHRQTLLPQWGAEGQERLAVAHAVIVGCGAIGCPAADLLARAGVGTLTLIDRDTVEPTNLHRQTLYAEADAAANLPKAEAARRRLSEINSTITVHAHVADLDPGAIDRLIPTRPTVVLDGTDNFETRFLLNDYAIRDSIPYLYAGAVATHAMAMPVLPGDPAMPCLRCLFRDLPPPGSQPTCDTAGVLGPVATMVGAYQAAEAIKICLGYSGRVARSLIEFDLWMITRRRVNLEGTRDPTCPCCANRTFDFLEGGRAAGSTTLCGRDAIQVTPSTPTTLDLGELASTLRPVAAITVNAFLLKADFHSEPVSMTAFRDGRALIHHAKDSAHARSIYARYIGS